MVENEAGFPAQVTATERLSCTTCRQRKTRCDRIHPCATCVKAGFECTFPLGRRRPREGRHELSLRLQKLESHLEHLAQSFNSQTASKAPSVTPLMFANKRPKDDQQVHASLPEAVGKLDINADSSQYSGNVLWATLRHEIAEMQHLLQDSGVVEVYDNDHTALPNAAPSQASTSENPSWLFQTQQPALAQEVITTNVFDTSILWTSYAENVAPLIKIFHFPTTKRLWQESSAAVRVLTGAEETVIQSIYFAAAVSLRESESQDLFNRSKDQILQIQQQSLERAFGTVELMSTASVMVLQAFVLYIVALRRLDGTRLLLSMIGIAIRLAVSIGLQRDGAKFEVDPFDTEMRRRVWYQISILDFEVSNDHGVEPLLRSITSDTSLPSNINDGDLYQGMARLPDKRLGFTEMTPSLVRFEICATARDLLYPTLNKQKMTLHQQRAAIEELQNRLREQYLKFCTNNDALQWSTVVVARSKITMLWVSMYHQLQQVSPNPIQDLNDKIMTAVTEICDDVRDLEANAKTAHFAWYFHNDVEWPATIYLLNAIIKRPPDDLTERAWDVVKRARDQWYANAGPKVRLQGMLYRPMRALTKRAFWVKEGKQPPSPAKVVGTFANLDIMEEFVPDQTDGFDVFDGFEHLENPFLLEPTGLSAQTALSAFETSISTAPEHMENFMLPLWNQNWQFLTQNQAP